MPDKKTTKSALESMMFIWGSPLEVKMAAEALGLSEKEVHDSMEELCIEYSNRQGGILIRRINSAYQFCTAAENEVYITKLCTPVKEKRLSNAAMEVLAIISYKQPVSRSEIEYIRGVKCEKVIEGLVQKGLVTEKGRGTGLGRPVLFGTTDLFLEKFGISDISELPEIDDIGDIAGRESENSETETQQIALEL